MTGSNNDSEISEEFIARIKARDHRWAVVEKAIRIEAELRDSVALRSILEVANEMAVEALEKIVYADPSDTKLIISLQAKIQRARLIGNTLEAIRRTGADAQRSLEAEGSVDVGGESADA